MGAVTGHFLFTKEIKELFPCNSMFICSLIPENIPMKKHAPVQSGTDLAGLRLDSCFVREKDSRPDTAENEMRNEQSIVLS